MTDTDANGRRQAGCRDDYRGEPMSNAKQSNGHGTAQSSSIWLSTTQIFEPLPATKWLSKDLQVGPGRPTMFAGYGNSKKSITLSAFGLAVAAGRPIWERFPTKPGVVRHLDYEMGSHPTRKRYQRLARGMGIDVAELGDRLELAVFPSIYLNSDGAVEAYEREVAGADVVILDALRGATPGVDENDSKIRICLDNLTRISERTSVAFLVIHHAGKPKEGHTDARMKVRGSSAIFDACGAVFVLEGSKDSPTKVSMQKPSESAEGGMFDDFLLSVEDVEVDGNPTGGVRVIWVPPIAQAVDRAAERKKASDQDCERMLTLVRQSPGASQNTLLVAFGGRRERAVLILDALADEGRVVVLPGPRGAKTYRPGDV